MNENKNLNFKDALKIYWGSGKTPVDNQFSNKFETNILFDYFTFSFPFDYEKDFQHLVSTKGASFNQLDRFCSNYLFLKLENAEERFRGTKKYQFGIKWDVPKEYLIDQNPATSFDYYHVPQQAKEGCFELSGACCRDFERRALLNEFSDDRCWYNLFNYAINHLNGSCSHIDIALDLKNLPIDNPFMWFFTKIWNGEYISPVGTFEIDLKFKDLKDYREFNKSILKCGGENSQVNIEIYDKKLEREKRKYTVDCESWIRIEFKFHGDKADAVINDLLKNWDNKENYILGILKKYLDFKERPLSNNDVYPDKHKRQAWKTSSFWNAVLGEFYKTKITNYFPIESSITKKASHVASDYRKVIASMMLGYNLDTFNLVIKKTALSGINDLTPNDLEVINTHRREMNLPDLTNEELKDYVNRLSAAIFNESDDVVSIDEESGLVTTKQDILNTIEFKGAPEYPADLFEKYEKKKNLNSLIASMKDYFKTHYDDFTEEEVMKFISDVVKAQKGV